MIDMEPQIGPSKGCILSLAVCCFGWAAVLLVAAWYWGWM